MSRTGLAERLRHSREYLGLSQEEVAGTLEISLRAITLIESGKKDIEAKDLGKLAVLYRVSLDYLQSGRDPETTAPTQFSFLARATKGLSDSDVQEVSRFAEFLKNCPN